MKLCTVLEIYKLNGIWSMFLAGRSNRMSVLQKPLPQNARWPGSPEEFYGLHYRIQFLPGSVQALSVILRLSSCSLNLLSFDLDTELEYNSHPRHINCGCKTELDNEIGIQVLYTISRPDPEKPPM